MAFNFLNEVKRSTPKDLFKLVDSPIYPYLRPIQKIECLELQIDAIKGMLRSYQKNINKLQYRIIEFEIVLGCADKLNLTSDQFIDFIEVQSKSEHKAKFMLNEFINCFIKGLPLNVPD